MTTMAILTSPLRAINHWRLALMRAMEVDGDGGAR